MGSVTPVDSWEGFRQNTAIVRCIAGKVETNLCRHVQNYSPILKKQNKHYRTVYMDVEEKDCDYDGRILAYLQGFNRNPPF